MKKEKKKKKKKRKEKNVKKHGENCKKSGGII